MDTTTQIVVGFLIAGILIVIGVLAFRFLARFTPNTPAQADILHALREYATQAILAGEMLALKNLESAQVDLSGLDKKAIADKFYALIPASIIVAGRSIPVGLIKSLISQAQWESLVQSVFDDVDALIARNEEWLTKQITLTTSALPNSGSGAITGIHTPQLPDRARANG